jgi:peptide/nickel transport system substrate-binding protein
VTRALLVLLLAVLATACEPDRSDLPQQAPDTLIVGKASDAIGLDPARVSDDESVEVCEQLYEHLVRYRPSSNEIEPELALSWEVDPLGTLWTFHLRPGVRFHDGTPMDADAVVFSFERQRDPFHPFHSPDFAYWKDQYSYIEKVEAVDPLTVRIRIERPYAPFLASLAMYPAAIVSPTAVKRWGADYPEHPVGTGPFRFESWKKGDRVVVVRNDDTWRERPRVRRLVFRRIPDARQRLIALAGGSIDVAYNILPEELQYVQLHPDLRLHRTSVNNVAYLAMNTQRPPFDDVVVRRAVNHAVNKIPIVKLIYQGLAEPASGPVPPTLWGYRADVATYAYDPAEARALLFLRFLEGRYEHGRRYRLHVPRTPRSYLPDPERIARVIQRNLAAAGVATELVVQDLAEHDESLRRREHDLCLFGWTADAADPDNFLKVLLDFDETRRGPEQNDAGYRNAEVHGLLTYAQETFDQEERSSYYHRAQAIIAAEAPWVPLAHSQLAVAARNEVQGLALHPTATVYYHRVWLAR